MRRLTLFGLIVTVLLCGSAAPSVHGDTTPTATPSPVPSATAVGKPSASRVLDLMMRAWQAAGSDHFVLYDVTENAAGKVRMNYGTTQEGDVAWQNPPLFRMQGPTYQSKRTPSGTVRKRVQEEQLSAENLLAVHLGKQKWTCDHFFGYSAYPGSPQWDETSPFGLVGKNLGVVTVKGAPAWLVQSAFAQLGPKGSRHPAYVTIRDYFASTTTFLPVEIQILTKTWTKHGTRTAGNALFFSAFGEAVHVTLPAACKNK